MFKVSSLQDAWSLAQRSLELNHSGNSSLLPLDGWVLDSL
jgi:hypothetical protein